MITILMLLTSIGVGYGIGLFMEGYGDEFEERIVWNPLKWFNITKYISTLVIIIIAHELLNRTW